MEQLIHELEQAKEQVALALTARTWHESRNHLAEAKVSLQIAINLAEHIERTRQAPRQGDQ